MIRTRAFVAILTLCLGLTAPLASVEGARKFGEVLQFTEARRADGAPLSDHILHEFLPRMQALAQREGLHALDLDVFRIVNDERPGETLLLIERYEDVREWAEAEYFAQRSDAFFEVMAQTAATGIVIPYSQKVVDDTPWPVEHRDGPIAVDFRTFERIGPGSVTDLVTSLRDLLDRSGFTDATVFYYGVLTGSGAERRHAYLWIEAPGIDRVNALSNFIDVHPDAAPWRESLDALMNPAGRRVMVRLQP